MSEVTLQQILQAREDRVRLQKQFLQTYRCPLIVFSMNIAGPTKTNPLIERGFYADLQMLQDALPAAAVREIHIHKVSTGWEGYLPVDLPANAVKNVLPFLVKRFFKLKLRAVIKLILVFVVLCFAVSSSSLVLLIPS